MAFYFWYDSFMKIKRFLWELFKTIIESLIIVFILIHFVLLPCMVQGSSMYPYLHNGDYGFSFIIKKNIKINRFDVAVIDVKSDDSKLLVKRIIGLPGEKIAFIDNQLYVNGEYVEEPFLEEGVITRDFEVNLKDDEYFCMGDNREVSRDSRSYGPFVKEKILSTGLFVIYPFSDFGFH